MFLIKGDNMQDSKHEYTNEIICPYCDYKFNDSWEYNQDGEDQTINCKNCNDKFNLSVNISVDYSTTKINCEDNNEIHDYKLDQYYLFDRKYLGNDKWEQLPKSEFKYKRIEICTKCDDNNYIEITKEEYEKNI
jgi:transcription elongation factor Elf1